jgi:NADPH:quinone reductase-like Zn-dependent oxidoreductase
MSIMKAVVLEAPGPPQALQIRDLPVPTPGWGRVLIKVVAFGLNRSELHTPGLVWRRALRSPASWGSRRSGRWRLAQAEKSHLVSRSRR